MKYRRNLQEDGLRAQAFCASVASEDIVKDQGELTTFSGTGERAFHEPANKREQGIQRTRQRH